MCSSPRALGVTLGLSLDSMTEKLRIYGNLGLIAGQLVLLFHSRPAGLAIILFCSCINLPYFVKNRYWDIVLLITVGMAINVAGIIWGVGK
jgi:hypothetical protein